MRFNRVFLKQTGRKVLLNAFLTAAIVFCTAMSVSIGTNQIGRLIVVSAGLSGVAAFCQSILEFRKHEQEKKGSNG